MTIKKIHGLTWWYGLGTLECAPLKISGWSPPNANLCGQVIIEFCLALNGALASGLWDWSPILVDHCVGPVF
ncbi:hypothetical protein MTR_6g075240 [Medicago truncatula]|uniref:Uncharacterized protein n=1 Tax=Medicago truncatula TaxID=3880 RepID=A0A072UAZ7_MEDTR|nr:hypothetical protein MTR_6g075240 [Medicago truncatula]